VPRVSDVTLTVYNILGEEVSVLHQGVLDAGRYWFTWDGRARSGNQVATGVYIARLRTERGESFTRKMLLLK
jgi:flagellar hook assembly protein FlgD